MLLTQLQWPMGCHGHHEFYVIQTGLFLETISFWHLVVPLNTFASMSKCPWVKGKHNKILPTPPPPPPMCVGDSYRYSMVLPQYLASLIIMNMQMR